MNTITAIMEPHEDGTLHLPIPEAWRHRAIRLKAEIEPIPSSPDQTPGKSLKGFGCLRGMISMSPGFDDPLEDFKGYIE